MSEEAVRFEIPMPGAVAWLDVSADNPDTWNGRRRTGPLGLQIGPLRHARAPYFFKGARLRGTRCIWSASTVSGAELYRSPHSKVPALFEGAVQILARVDGGGSVFDPIYNALGGALAFFVYACVVSYVLMRWRPKAVKAAGYSLAV